jgi:epoxyqueuosine reductase QueG
MSLSSEIKEIILSKGAKQVGFADLSDMGINNFNGNDLGFKVKSGICFLINLDANIVKDIEDGPTKEYLDSYMEINEKLDDIALYIEDYLKSKGYKAYALTRDRTNYDYVYDNECRNTIPYKTIATRAGLGWIGKCALFLTNEYGSAVRLCAVITDAPLEYGKPVTASLCGKCTDCRDICPGGAVSGITWSPNLEREDFYDYKKCLEGLMKESKKNLGYEFRICGRCIGVCPKTKKYIRHAL